MAGFGKAKFGGEASWGRLKLKAPQGNEKTSTVARVLPPYGNQEKTGKWALYCSVHFGFEGKSRTDPTKTQARPFGCVEVRNMRTKMTEVSCPMCELIAVREDALKRKMAEFIAKGKTEEEAKVLTKDLREWLRKYNVDRKWYMAVMTEDGKFHILTISHTLKKVLESRISDLRQQDIDPLDPATGVWFNFTREGKGLQTKDDVVVVTESFKEGGRTFSAPKSAPLNDAQIEQALSTLPSLDTVVTQITRDQIAQLAQCSGDPEEVDAILNVSSPAGNDASTTTSKPLVAKAPVKTETVEAAAEVDDEEAELLAKLAAKKAAKAAAAQTAPKTVAKAAKAPEPAADVDFENMSDEDFLNQFPDPSKA